MWGQGGGEDFGVVWCLKLHGERGQRQNLDDSTCNWQVEERRRREKLAEEGAPPGAVSVTLATAEAWRSAWHTVGA